MPKHVKITKSHIIISKGIFLKNTSFYSLVMCMYVGDIQVHICSVLNTGVGGQLVGVCYLLLWKHQG